MISGVPFPVPSVVFWFGDLNFRIEDYDIHVVKCAIDSNKLPLLWERDQVRPLQYFKTLTPSQTQTDISGRLCATCLSRKPEPTEGAVAQNEQTSPFLRLYLNHPGHVACSVLFPIICLLYSSTWLKTQSPSWKASWRDN